MGVFFRCVGEVDSVEDCYGYGEGELEGAEGRSCQGVPVWIEHVGSFSLLSYFVGISAV